MTTSYTSKLLGTDRAIGQMDRMQREAMRSSRDGLAKVQGKVRASVRARLNGPPRWNYRGRSGVYTTPVAVDGRQHQEHLYAGTGGRVGSFTGGLRDSVHGRNKRRMPVIGDSVYGVVVVGTRGSDGTAHNENNLFKGKLEERFHFFRDGAERGLRGADAVMAKEWQKGVERAVHR